MLFLKFLKHVITKEPKMTVMIVWASIVAVVMLYNPVIGTLMFIIPAFTVMIMLLVKKCAESIQETYNKWEREIEE